MGLRYTVTMSIPRPPKEVFAFCSDLRHELMWNPRAEQITKVEDGPTGVGTRFWARWRGAPRTMVEVTEYVPGERWATRSRSLGMEVIARGRVEPRDGGTRLTTSIEARASGLARIFAPFLIWMMRRQEPRNIELIRRCLIMRTA